MQVTIPELCRYVLISHCLQSIYTFLYTISHLANLSWVILTWQRNSDLIPSSWERFVPPCWYNACLVCGAWRAWWEFFQSHALRFHCVWSGFQVPIGRCPGFSLKAQNHPGQFRKSSCQELILYFMHKFPNCAMCNRTISHCKVSVVGFHYP